MKQIILVDMRDNNGQVMAIENDNGTIAQYKTRLDAISVSTIHPLCKAFPYVIIDIDKIMSK